MQHLPSQNKSRALQFLGYRRKATFQKRANLVLKPCGSNGKAACGRVHTGCPEGGFHQARSIIIPISDYLTLSRPLVFHTYSFPLRLPTKFPYGPDMGRPITLPVIVTVNCMRDPSSLRSSRRTGTKSRSLLEEANKTMEGSTFPRPCSMPAISVIVRGRKGR